MPSRTSPQIIANPSPQNQAIIDWDNVEVIVTNNFSFQFSINVSVASHASLVNVFVADANTSFFKNGAGGYIVDVVLLGRPLTEKLVGIILKWNFTGKILNVPFEINTKNSPKTIYKSFQNQIDFVNKPITNTTQLKKTKIAKQQLLFKQRMPKDMPVYADIDIVYFKIRDVNYKPPVKILKHKISIQEGDFQIN